MRVGLSLRAATSDPSRPLVLGGIELADRSGLSGGPDGDALALAAAEAVLGAAGRTVEGEEAAATGMEYLREAVRAIEGANYQVVNLDATLVTERVEWRPRASELRSRLAERLHVGPRHVTLKEGGRVGAGTPEGSEETGPTRSLGLPAGRVDLLVVAVALVDRMEGIEALHADLRGIG